MLTHKPERESVAEPEDRVLGSRMLHSAERPIRPLGKLLGEQATDERFVDLAFVRVHSRHLRGLLTASCRPSLRIAV
jgi:hypothetical protein